MYFEFLILPLFTGLLVFRERRCRERGEGDDDDDDDADGRDSVERLGLGFYWCLLRVVHSPFTVTGFWVTVTRILTAPLHRSGSFIVARQAIVESWLDTCFMTFTSCLFWTMETRLRLGLRDSFDVRLVRNWS